MKERCLLTLIALSAVAFEAQAGPFRRRVQPAYPPPSYVQPAAQTAFYTPVATASTTAATSAGVGDGLDEVNTKRASRGLRPFVRDDALTQAAQACAAFRAEHLMFGHTSNDFAFLPAGTSAASAGCAAYEPSYGWMSCCVDGNYTYAGAAYVTGRDGRRYMQLFVR